MTLTATLTVDLAAVAANWRALRLTHAPGAVAGVVKADGYGLGAAEVAATLRRAGCRHFFVAHLAEALAIRDLVPDAMLAVLHGPAPGEAAEFAAREITPVLCTLDQVHAWSAEARRQGLRLPAILHVDTGMNRLGLGGAELAALQADHGWAAPLDLRFVLSHFASSERPDDTLNPLQRARLAAIRARLPPAPVSMANSSGMFLPGPRCDLARPGGALYGLNPTPGRPNPMRQVVRLDAPVLAVRQIGPGETVGYNATWRAERASRIATIGVGYGDGWPRALSNRGTARFDGTAIPLVGRVSMDLATYDVTDCPAIGPGAMLELIGPGNPPEDVAREAGTIGYEILTALGRRYSRRYLPA